MHPIAWLAQASLATQLTQLTHGELSPRLENATLAPGSSYSVAICRGATAAGCSLECGGTLLLPNLVLTSRHCGDSQPPAPVDCATYRFDGPLVPAESAWITSASMVSAGARFHRGAQWNSPRARGCGHDLALLTLAAGDAFATNEAALAPIALDEAAVSAVVGASLRVYGYGRTREEEGAADGNRRGRDAHVLCTGGLDACSAVPQGDTLSLREFAVDALVCPGDSGSGVHDPGGTLLGPLGRSIGGTSPCGYGVYTKLAPHAQWLARITRDAARSGSYEVPAWVASAVDAPRDFGASCDDDDDCDSGACRSYDGGLSWMCAYPCSTGCEGTCRTLDDGAYCFPNRDAPSPDEGCAISAQGSSRPRSPMLLATLVLLAGAVRRFRAM